MPEHQARRAGTIVAPPVRAGFGVEKKMRAEGPALDLPHSSQLCHSFGRLRDGDRVQEALVES